MKSKRLQTISKVDIVLSFLESDDARLNVSEICLEMGIPFFDANTQEDGFTFHISMVMPGQVIVFTKKTYNM